MLFLRNTHSPVAEGVYLVDVAAKPPGKTFAVIAALDADNPPQTFLAALEGLGFKRAESKTYTHGDGKKVLDVQYQKPGTDLFQGWTNAEKDANLTALETMLGGFNINVTPRVMSMAEAYQ
ncbi:MAG TPA: hypothetical protein VF798_05470 [Burkholderiaceae bacterium]